MPNFTLYAATRTPGLRDESVVALRVMLNLLQQGRSAVGAIDFDDKISNGQAFGLWFIATIRHAQVLSGSHILAIAQAFGEYITQLGGTLLAGMDLVAPELFVVADRRYVKFTGQPQYYDLNKGDYVDSIPTTIEGISYNMREIADNYNAIIQEQTNGVDQSTATNAN